MLSTTLLRTTLSVSATRTMSTIAGLNAVARAKAEIISKNWKGTNATGGKTKYVDLIPTNNTCSKKLTDVYRNFIGGQFVESQATEWIDVLDPVSHGKPQRDSAVFNSNKFPFSPLKHYWHEFHKPPQKNSHRLYKPPPKLSNRGDIPVYWLGSVSFSSELCFDFTLYLGNWFLCRCRLQRLVRENQDSIAESIVLEQGKTFAGGYRFIFYYTLKWTSLFRCTRRCPSRFTSGWNVMFYFWMSFFPQ